MTIKVTEPCYTYLKEDYKLGAFGVTHAILKTTGKLSDEQERLVLEMILCRSVDNFLVYISELLALIYTHKPQMLRSHAEPEKSRVEKRATDEYISLDAVLECETIEELISSIAEKRVHDLSYKGLKDLNTYFQKNYKFDLVSDKNKLERIVVLVEYRNLIVHNRGKANRIFKDRVPSYEGELGEELNFSTIPFGKDISLVRDVVLDIDARAALKWELPCDNDKPYS